MVLKDRQHIIPQIPDYFNDSRLLIHLSFALYPQFRDQALKKIALDYLDSEKEETEERNPNVDMTADDDEEMIAADIEGGEESEEEIEILEEVHAIFKTPKKKKALKVKEQLDDSFLRRSSRLSIKAERYKDAEVPRKPRNLPRPKPDRSRRRTKRMGSPRQVLLGLRMNPCLLP